MTGLENIYMNGTLIGMIKDEIDQKKQTIIDFSDMRVSTSPSGSIPPA